MKVYNSLPEFPIEFPQGFVLGPALFILFTNRLEYLIHLASFKLQGYADDRIIFHLCFPDAKYIIKHELVNFIDTVSS